MNAAEYELTGWFKPVFGRIYDPAKIREAEGLPKAELSKLSNLQLRRYLEKMIEIEVSYYEDGYLGFVYHVIDAYNADLLAPEAMPESSDRTAPNGPSGASKDQLLPIRVPRAALKSFAGQRPSCTAPMPSAVS